LLRRWKGIVVVVISLLLRCVHCATPVCPWWWWMLLFLLLLRSEGRQHNYDSPEYAAEEHSSRNNNSIHKIRTKTIFTSPSSAPPLFHMPVRLSPPLCVCVCVCVCLCLCASSEVRSLFRKLCTATPVHATVAKLCRGCWTWCSCPEKRRGERNLRILSSYSSIFSSIRVGDSDLLSLIFFDFLFYLRRIFWSSPWSSFIFLSARDIPILSFVCLLVVWYRNPECCCCCSGGSLHNRRGGGGDDDDLYIYLKIWDSGSHVIIIAMIFFVCETRSFWSI